MDVANIRDETRSSSSSDHRCQGRNLWWTVQSSMCIQDWKHPPNIIILLCVNFREWMNWLLFVRQLVNTPFRRSERTRSERWGSRIARLTGQISRPPKILGGLDILVRSTRDTVMGHCHTVFLPAAGSWLQSKFHLRSRYEAPSQENLRGERKGKRCVL